MQFVDAYRIFFEYTYIFFEYTYTYTAKNNYEYCSCFILLTFPVVIHVYCVYDKEHLPRNMPIHVCGSILRIMAIITGLSQTFFICHVLSLFQACIHSVKDLVTDQYSVRYGYLWRDLG